MRAAYLRQWSCVRVCVREREYLCVYVKYVCSVYVFAKSKGVTIITTYFSHVIMGLVMS